MIIYYNKDTFGYPINIVKNAMYDPNTYKLFRLDSGLSYSSRSHCVLFNDDLYTLKYYNGVGLKLEKRNPDMTSTLLRDFGDGYVWNSAYIFVHDANLFVFICEGNNFHYHRYDGTTWVDDFTIQHGGSVKICDVIWYQNKIHVVLDNCIIQVQIGLSPTVQMAGISFAGSKFCEYNTKLYLLNPVQSRLSIYSPDMASISDIKQYTGMSHSTHMSGMIVHNSYLYYVMPHLRGMIFERYNGTVFSSWLSSIPITLNANSSDVELHKSSIEPVISCSSQYVDGILWKSISSVYSSYSIINDTKFSWSYI